MPISLRDLAPLAERTYSLRGRDVQVRAVMAAESRALSEQIPDPPPPHMPPGYTEAQREAEMNHHWRGPEKALAQARRRAALAGVAAGIVNDRGEAWDRTRPAAWACAYADSIIEALTEAEITALYQLQMAIECGAFDELKRVIGTAKERGN